MYPQLIMKNPSWAHKNAIMNSMLFKAHLKKELFMKEFLIVFPFFLAFQVLPSNQANPSERCTVVLRYIGP